MKISPNAVFSFGGPVKVVNTGGYRYQPGTILTALNPSPTVPTFGSSFSPPAVPTIGSLWGSIPASASGNPYSPNIGLSRRANPVSSPVTKTVAVSTPSTNTGGGGFFSVAAPSAPATNTGGGGFFQSVSGGLFS